MLGGSLCIFSCLLLAWTKWNKQNKEPIREHSWDWVGEVWFYRGRSKGKYLPPGQGFIYSAGGSQITPKGSDAFREHWRILCTWVGALALWTEPEGWFLKMFRTPSLAKGQTAWEGMIFVFKELISLLGRKGMICTKSLKILIACSHAWHKPSGPGRVSDSDNPGV